MGAMVVEAAAPGKILLLGGYSVLEKGTTNFVLSVNAMVRARVKRNESDIVEIDVPMFKARCRGKINLKTGKMDMDVPKELTLVMVAAEITARYALAQGSKISGFTISTSNDGQISYVPEGAGKAVVKSGLGSSAAVVVATVSGLMAAFDINPKKDDALHKLAQLAHGLGTGKVGSGFDIAAAVYGSSIYSRYSPGIVKDFPADYSNAELLETVERKWDYKIRKMALPKEFHLCFAKIAGGSAITTSFVKKVNEFKERDPQTYKDLIEKIDAQNVMAIKMLKNISGGKDVERSMAFFRATFESGRLLTKRLGEMSDAEIEPNDLTALIEGSKECGAFVAKLPGAGGRDAIVALCLSENDRKHLVRFWKSVKALEVLELETR